MKKFLLFALFLLGMGWAISNFSGLATQGIYDSIVLDFQENMGEGAIAQQVEILQTKYQLSPRLNSEFSANDHIYIVTGDQAKLKQQLKLLRKDFAKYTEYIEPNYIYQTTDQGDYHSNLVPNDPLYGKQWNFRNIHVEKAWASTKGDGVTVAVIDTGVSQVPDLANTKFTAGYDFVSDRTEVIDDNGHGTHVAGTIAQSTNNNLGVAGIAYEASIMPLKVLSAEGGGTVTDIAEAIKYAADHQADVINLSLGGAGESSAMSEAIEYAYNKGVVIIAAAGNANQNAAGYPARYPHVMGVSALDVMGAKAPYSNFGAGVDISAPGGAIDGEDEAGGILQNTVDPDTGESVFVAFQGTSMAAPHVAGVAALLKASGLQSPDEIINVLKQSARPVAEDPFNHFGAGHLDAGEAVALAEKGQITFRDFFRWLRDNGYLNIRFWLDGGAVALLPKIAMMLSSYLLAWLIRNYFAFSWRSSFLHFGLIAGSSGLFFLKGFYIFDLPQWPMRLMGSSLTELGGTIQGSSVLNPLFASVLIPFMLIVLFLSHAELKWLAIGSSIGVASALGVSVFLQPTIWGIGSGAIAQIFLLVNALLCFGLARLAVKPEVKLS
jgi:serine protease